MTTGVLSLTPELSIKDAIKLFVEKGISGAPVVDEAGKLLGILSESDLLWKDSHGPQDNFIVPPIYLGLFDTFVYLRDEDKFKQQTEKMMAKTVGDAMTKKVVTATPDMVLSDVADKMLFKKVNRLPVVDSDGVVVGVMTRSDVLRGMMGGACAIDFA